MGLSGCNSANKQYTVGFIRVNSQANTHIKDQPSNTRPNTTRHNQANIWVYQAISQAILQVGFVRLLRQWTRRAAKLVSSSIELRTPSQDLCGLTTTWSTHPTQGSVPFSAPQSLGLHLPFQCSSGCERRFTSHSYLIVRFHTRFIKHILHLFHS